MVEKTVGAVRTKIKLTNAVDEDLVSRGLLVPKLLRTCEVEALVDTGSVYLVLPETVVQQLGLRIVGQQPAIFADGRQTMVDVTGAVGIEWEGWQTIENALVTGNLVTGNKVLIGQVVLEKLDLLVDCKNQRLIRNPKHPDYPVTYIL